MDADEARAGACVFNISRAGKKMRARLAVFAIEQIAHRIAASSVRLAVGGGSGVQRNQLGGFGGGA
jgi:hypothetical protein